MCFHLFLIIMWPCLSDYPSFKSYSSYTLRSPSYSFLNFIVHFKPSYVTVMPTFLQALDTQTTQLNQKHISVLHLIFHRLTVVQVLFRRLKRGLTATILMLCFVLINSVLSNLFCVWTSYVSNEYNFIRIVASPLFHVCLTGNKTRKTKQTKKLNDVLFQGTLVTFVSLSKRQITTQLVTFNLSLPMFLSKCTWVYRGLHHSGIRWRL